MPSINGVDLCHALQKRYRSTTKFVALTAHVLKEEKDSILDEGFDAILTKPFREKELMEVLDYEISVEELSENTPDLSALRQMTLNDEALFQSVLSQFVEETSDDIRQLRSMLTASDPKAVREVVHRLSGRLAQIGIRALGAKFSMVETSIVSGKPVDELKDEIQRLVTSVERLISHLRLTTLQHLN